MIAANYEQAGVCVCVWVNDRMIGNKLQAWAEHTKENALQILIRAFHNVIQQKQAPVSYAWF